jgi:hypothetical protein
VQPVLSQMSVPTGRRREQRHLPTRSVPVWDAAGTRRGDLIVFEAAVEQRGDTLRLLRLEGILILR